jgi:urocanate hydratase
MNIKIDKAMMMGAGRMAGKLGKTIVIEGTKAVILNAAATTIKTSFDDGFEGVKGLSFDDLLDGTDKKDKKKKKVSLFGRKKKHADGVKEEEDIEAVILDEDGNEL